jgi:hypothetical protein
MSRWYVPLTLLGLGGLGVVLTSDRGRGILNRAADFLEDLPENYSGWQDYTEREIATIQSAVDEIAASLGAFQPAR